jgi:hypothetical protein
MPGSGTNEMLTFLDGVHGHRRALTPGERSTALGAVSSRVTSNSKTHPIPKSRHHPKPETPALNLNLQSSAIPTTYTLARVMLYVYVPNETRKVLMVGEPCETAQTSGASDARGSPDAPRWLIFKGARSQPSRLKRHVNSCTCPKHLFRCEGGYHTCITVRDTLFLKAKE